MLTMYLHQPHTLCTVGGIKTPPHPPTHSTTTTATTTIIQFDNQVEFNTKENVCLCMSVGKYRYVAIAMVMI